MKKALVVYTIFILFIFGCEKNKKQKIETIKQSVVTKKDKEKSAFIKNVSGDETVSKQKSVQLQTMEHLPPYSFTKGIYLNAYTVASKKFQAILDSAETAGINTVVFDLKNMNGHIFFRVPKLRNQKGKIKPIVDIPRVVEKLHQRKMRAVGRIVMFHDQFTAEQDTLLRPQNRKKNTVWKESKRRKAAWLDPSQPQVQKELLKIISKAASEGIDGIQLDYIRFPTQGNIGDARFHYQSEDSLTAANDSTFINRTKIDIIEDFVKKVKKVCKKYNTTLGGDIFAIVAWQRRADVQNTGQDIKKLTKYLNEIHPMIYSSHFAANFGFRKNVPNEPYYIVYKGTKLTKKYADKNCRIIPYIQANSWKVNYKPEYIYAQIDAVKAAKADGYILWNAANRYFKTLNWIRKYH